MSAKGVKPGLREQAKGISKRIDEVEKNGLQIMRIVTSLQEQLNQQAMFINAITQHVGAEEIQEILDEQLLNSKKLEAEQNKQEIDRGVAAGYIVPVSTIDEETIVVAWETDEQGEDVLAGRRMFAFEGSLPQYKEKLRGQTVGFEMETDQRTKLTVKEIYRVDREVLETHQEKQAKEQLAAAEAAAKEATSEELGAEAL